MSRRRSRPPSPQMPQPKSYVSTVTDVGLVDGLHEMTVSTASVDRDGDRVLPEGMDAASYVKNPVLMWAHDYSAIPIGTVQALTAIDGQSIKARFKFLENDPFADRVQNAWNQGAVRAASLGFRPKTWVESDTGYDITGWELLEVSLCPIPANAEAVRALKALGVIEEPAAEPGPPADPAPEPAPVEQKTVDEAPIVEPVPEPEPAPAPDPVTEKAVETPPAPPVPPVDVAALLSRLDGMDAQIKALSAPPDPDPVAILEKIGRRNSAADLSVIQQCHDMTVALGAACSHPDEDEPKSVSGPYLTLTDTPESPRYTVDPQELESAMRLAMKEHLGDLVTAAISRARGRLD